MTERLRAFTRALRRETPGGPPPCVGCRKGIDRLETVSADEIRPSVAGTLVGPVDGLQSAVVDDSLIVLDAASGRRVLLNATAALIFTAVDREVRVADLTSQIAGEVGVDPVDVQPDVSATVDRLIAQGMLTRDGTLEAATPTPPVSGVDQKPEPGPGDHDAPVDWAYESGPRVAAGATVAVDVELGGPADALHAVLEAFAPAATGPDHRVEVLRSGSSTDRGRGGADTFQIVVDGTAQRTSVPSGSVPARVVDQLDAVLSTRSAGLRFHAGAVERDGDVAIVLGQSGDGKSTLTAALVQAGWGYLTDELVVVEPHTFAVAPYARPLDLDRTARGELGIDEADLSTGGAKDKVHPGRFGTVSDGGRVAAIVVLTGRPAADGAIVSDLPTPEAVMALLALTFAATFDDPDALAQLAGLCAAVPTVRLHRAPLGDMIAAVDEIVVKGSSGVVGHRSPSV